MRPCQSDGHCVINKLTRSSCGTCRLEKCFSQGMDMSLIRSIPAYPRVNKKVPRPSTSEERQVELPMVKFFFMIIRDYFHRDSLLANDT